MFFYVLLGNVVVYYMGLVKRGFKGMLLNWVCWLCRGYLYICYKIDLFRCLIVQGGEVNLRSFIVRRFWLRLQLSKIVICSKRDSRYFDLEMYKRKEDSDVNRCVFGFEVWVRERDLLFM